MNALLSLLIASGIFSAQTPISSHEDVPCIINMDFADSSRSNWLGTGPRLLSSLIWYPAEICPDPETLCNSHSPIFSHKDKKDSRIPSAKKKYPLILISHGAGGQAENMSWLSSFLASKGYIAVTVNHNGTDEEERKTGSVSLSDFCMWERPRDISVVLDRILKDPEFAEIIDTSKIGCAGFSLGGATAIWIAGAIFSMEELSKHEPPPPDFMKESINRLTDLSKTDPVVKNSLKHSADSFRDKRIKAVFALAPAIGQGFTKEGLENITIPVQIVVGKEDKIAPLERDAEHYAKHIPTARTIIILPGERGHYTTPISIAKRDADMLEVSKLAFSFFTEVLK